MDLRIELLSKVEQVFEVVGSGFIRGNIKLVHVNIADYQAT